MNLFSCVTDNGYIYRYDIRDNKEIDKIQSNHELTTLDYHPKNSMLLTGCVNGNVILWEDKSLKKLHTFYGHSESVLKVEWGMNDPIFASSSSDKRVHIWDMTKIGQHQTPEQGGVRKKMVLNFNL